MNVDKKKIIHRKQNNKSKFSQRYSFEFKLKAVKLYLQEDYSRSFICEQINVSLSTLSKWIKLYRDYGEDGLRPNPKQRSKSNAQAIIEDKIIQTKKKNPLFGCQKISDFLKRFSFIKTNPETVRQTLKKHNLNNPPNTRKRQRNVSKPRFFERSKPNQMWQTDIMTFRLGGQNAYLIAYIDDYSRFITSIGLFRSQTAEHVIEVFRMGISEFGLPKELLTDNGRQYTNWRGTTRFEQQLKKNNIIHIKSRPHHPMTLGKIERFWKTIFEEFFSRVQFNDFDEARSRLRLWVKYYNHKRPHQGIGGLCPADRFFEIDNELKKTIQKGINDNILEMALRGAPKQPFYMVGRLGSQEVSLKAEKGKISMLIDDSNETNVKEITYDIMKGASDGNQQENPEQGHDHSPDQMRSGSCDMDPEPKTGGCLPGTECPMVDRQPMAGPSAQSDAPSTGTQTDSAAEPDIAQESTEAVQSPCRVTQAETGVTEDRTETQQNSERTEPDQIQPVTTQQGCDYGPSDLLRNRPHRSGTDIPDHESSDRTTDSDQSRQTAGDIPQNVLPTGEPGSGRNDDGPDAQVTGPTEQKTGSPNDGDAQRNRSSE